MHRTQNRGYHGVGAGRSTDWEVTGGSFWCQKCSVLNPDGGFMDPCVSHWAVCLRSVSFKFLLNVYLYFNKISLFFLSIAQLYIWKNGYIIHALNITGNSVLGRTTDFFNGTYRPQLLICSYKIQKAMKSKVSNWPELMGSSSFIPHST